MSQIASVPRLISISTTGKSKRVLMPVKNSMISTSLKLSALLALVVVMVGGCSKIDARRLEHDGSRLYKEGKFKAAAETYEASLAKEDLAITHHNLALTYVKLFKAGCNAAKDKDKDGTPSCPDNETYAAKATEHFATYLKTDPKDVKVRDMMSKVWLDNNQIEKALEFWESELKNDPKNADIMGKLAGINFKGRRWRESMDWYHRQAESSDSHAAKGAAYQSIGNVSWAILSNREKTLWEDRIECADRGVTALSKAAELFPKKPEVQGLMSAIYNFRAIANGPIWAGAIDRATAQTHADIRRVLIAEAKAAEALKTGVPVAPPAGTSPVLEKPATPVAPVTPLEKKPGG
jgi:tetratricopeptide (TPR) repeat protein